MILDMLLLNNINCFSFENVEQAERVNFREDFNFKSYLNKYKCKNKHLK